MTHEFSDFPPVSGEPDDSDFLYTDQYDEPESTWRGDMLPDGEDATDEEPLPYEPRPFGLQQFDGQDIAPDALLPDEYKGVANAWYESLYGRPGTGEAGIFGQHAVFHDVEPLEYGNTTGTREGQVIDEGYMRSQNPYIDPDARTVQSASHFDLEYRTPEGRAAIRILNGGVSVRFTAEHGDPSYAHYQSTWRPPQPPGPYEQVIYKDTEDVLAAAPPLAPGRVPSREALKRELGALRAHSNRLQQEGIALPIAGVPELQYLMHEVLPNAMPPGKSFEDVLDVRWHETVKRRPPAPLEGRPGVHSDEKMAAALYEQVMVAYRSGTIRPDRITEAAGRIVIADGTALTHIDTMIDPRFSAPGGLIRGFRTMTTLTHTNRYHGDELDTILARRRIPLPPGLTECTISDRLIFGYHHESGLFMCRSQTSLAVEGVTLARKMPVAFRPSYNFMKVFRNYLLIGPPDA